MKVDRTTPQGPIVPRRGVKPRASGNGFDDALGGSSGSGTVSGNGEGAKGVAGMDALLALQEVADPGGTPGQAHRHGERLLDHLEVLRLEILNGRVPAESVERLAEAVKDARAKSGDARLDGILDEIELRAQVELAKLGR